MTRRRNTSKVVGIDHLVLRVSDFEASKAFYEQLFAFLGFKLHEDYGDAIGWWNGQTRFYISKADAKDRRRGHKTGDVGIHHYAFELRRRSDVYALGAFLEEMGAEVVDPPDEYYPNYYAVFFLDPDGIKLEGMKYDESDGD